MKYIVLEKDEFAAEYNRAFQTLNLESELEKKQFRDELFSVQGAVEEALKENWQQEVDFEVGWDFNYCYHTCGGIYSERIFCKDYVATIIAALQSVDKNGLWTYHTACEIIINRKARTIGEAMEVRGELFVRGDSCYINGSTMKPKWRAQLGCST